MYYRYREIFVSKRQLVLQKLWDWHFAFVTRLKIGRYQQFHNGIQEANTDVTNSTIYNEMRIFWFGMISTTNESMSQF